MKLACLCRLAAHINGYSCFQIELSRGYDYIAFHEDLKKLYESAGVQNQHTVFLFTDTQVHNCVPSVASVTVRIRWISPHKDVDTRVV